MSLSMCVSFAGRSLVASEQVVLCTRTRNNTTRRVGNTCFRRLQQKQPWKNGEHDLLELLPSAGALIEHVEASECLGALEEGGAVCARTAIVASRIVTTVS